MNTSEDRGIARKTDGRPPPSTHVLTAFRLNVPLSSLDPRVGHHAGLRSGKFLLYWYEISWSDITFSAVSAFPFIFMFYFTINWGHTAGMTYSAVIITI